VTLKGRKGAGKIAVPAFEIEPDVMKKAFQAIALTRALDEELISSLTAPERSNYCSCKGHEAIQVAAGMLFRPERDEAFLYPRDLGFFVSLFSFDELDTILSFCKGFIGAGMPERREPEMPAGISAAISLQPAVPQEERFFQAAAAAKLYQKEKREGVVVLFSGEGAARHGAFYELVNEACVSRLPLLFIIESNGLVQGLPARTVLAGRSVFELTAGFAHLQRFRVDGANFSQSYSTLRHALQTVQKKKQPAMVVADVPPLYREQFDSEAALHRDPLRLIASELSVEPAAVEQQVQAYRTRLKAHIQRPGDPSAFEEPQHAHQTGTEPYKALETLVLERKKLKWIRPAGGKMLSGALNSIPEHVISTGGSLRSRISEALIWWKAGYEVVVEEQSIQAHEWHYSLGRIQQTKAGLARAPALLMLIHDLQEQAGKQDVTSGPSWVPYKDISIALPASPAAACTMIEHAITNRLTMLMLLPEEPRGGLDQEAATLPGRAVCYRRGSRATVLCFGRAIHEVSKLPEALQAQLSVLEMGTLWPIDESQIVESVQQTGRLVLLCGYMSLMPFMVGLAGYLQQKCFGFLDAPVWWLGVEQDLESEIDAVLRF